MDCLCYTCVRFKVTYQQNTCVKSTTLQAECIMLQFMEASWIQHVQCCFGDTLTVVEDY